MITSPEPTWIRCLPCMKKRTNEIRSHKRKKDRYPSGRRYSFGPTTAIYNRAATEFSVLPRTVAVRTGLGAGASTSKKPPAFRNGKQVVLSIWVPGGIACEDDYISVMHFRGIACILAQFFCVAQDCCRRWLVGIFAFSINLSACKWNGLHRTREKRNCCRVYGIFVTVYKSRNANYAQKSGKIIR